MKVQITTWLGALLLMATFGSPASAERERIIQTTQSFHRTTGWEKPLIQASPNLKNFYWTPLTGVNTSYRKVPLPDASDARARNSLAQKVAPIGSRYKKMGHAAPPVPKRSPSRETLNRRTEVGGQIYNPPAAFEEVRVTRTSTYGSYSTGSANTSLTMRNTEVRGSLLRK